MRRMWRLSLALIVAGPGPVFAQVMAPVEVRLVTPIAPVPGALGPLSTAFEGGTSSPYGSVGAPGLSAPSLTAPALNAPAPQAPTPALAAAAIPALPAAAVPAALAARPVPPAAAKAAKPGVPGEQQEPKTALEGLKTELEAPKPDDSDLAGGREHAARSFEAKLGIMSFVPAALTAFTEGAFHPLAKVKTPPPAQAGDDGGGPTKSRPVAFNGESFPSVAFRPNEPVESHIVRAIESSKESIQIALYEFTSRGILKALLAAKKRGVKIEVILCDSSVNPHNEADADYKRYRSEQIWALIRNDLDVTVIGRPTKYGINHHKFAVFDGKMAEFGSYNWTYTSEKNHYENVLFSADADRVKAYQDAWKHLRALSVSVAESATKEWPLDVPAPPSDAQKRISFNGTKLPAWIFNPGDLFEDSIAAAIDASKVSVDAGQFVLESRKIADALERALARGVKVRVVADKSQSAYDHVQLFLGFLQRLGAQVRILGGPNGEESDYPLAEKMHNKYFVFDGMLVETGSGNATKNAGVNNFENANFLNDKTDVAAFVKTFSHMFDIAETAPAYPAGELPTDQQMRDNALSPRGPPAPPDPAHDPLPAARRIAFNGVDFPANAMRPNEPVEIEIIKAIDSAAKTLRIAMYELNQEGVWDALQRAKKRGIKIEVVLDRSHVYTSGYEDDGSPRKPKQMVVDLLKDSGFSVLLLKGRLGGIMHNKFIVVDEGLVEFGSYNYTHQSEEDHYENVFFSIEKARVSGYAKYFEYMRSIAEEPDMEKLDAIVSRADAALPEADDAEPEAAGKRKPLPPDPPQETETPISLNGERFPIQMFSPNAGIEKALVRAIEASKLTISIAMFSFFSQPIAEALLRAKDRGVKIQIVMDKSQTGTSKLDDWFAWHGFDLRLISGPDRARDPRYQKMHNKLAIFDGLMLESGSFNYSTRAETLSFENANFFNDADLIARYVLYFSQMFERGMAPKAPRREPKFALPSAEPEA
ncbi:MAG: phospholipase D-like domain-containing protein [Elusimicrobia bacterium]|nr:phospholipase D-like domain-containing protein [Elusimicrobiota bacterium]